MREWQPCFSSQKCVVYIHCGVNYDWSLNLIFMFEVFEQLLNFYCKVLYVSSFPAKENYHKDNFYIRTSLKNIQ